MNKTVSFFLSKESDEAFIGLNSTDKTTISCRGEILTAQKVGLVDAAREKHIPVLEVNGNSVKVKVGAVEHPMLNEHHISWVCLKSEKGLQFKELPAGGKPEVEFLLTPDDKAIEAYEFCNLHGVWMGK